MKTAVLYTSKHGTTYSIAKHISMALSADVFSLNELEVDSLSHYETIILGTPIYAGKSYGNMDLFCRDNLDTLLAKRIALFASGLTASKRKQQRQLQTAYLKPLYNHSSIAVFVGGAINISKLTLVEKLLTKTRLKVDADVTDIDQPAIELLIAAVA